MSQVYNPQKAQGLETSSLYEVLGKRGFFCNLIKRLPGTTWNPLHSEILVDSPSHPGRRLEISCLETRSISYVESEIMVEVRGAALNTRGQSESLYSEY